MLSTESDRATVSEIERSEMRRVLEKRQRELLSQIQSRVRDVREEGSNHDRHVTEPGDTEAEPENDLSFALIQMKAETADKIAAALRRFDEGTFGLCLDCEVPIPKSRLRALPFAVRCRDCEQAREDGEQHARRSQLVLNRL
jgi:DnaK suppressor protein